MIPWWAVGVLVSVVGAFLDNLGVTIQKSSHMMRGGDEAVGDARTGSSSTSSSSPYYRETRWLVGFAVFLVGNIFNVVGLGLAPETLFAAIGGVTLAANAVNSRWLLGEPMSGRVVAATVLIIAGSVVAVLFARHPAEDFDLDDLAHFLTPGFFAYAGAVAALMAALGLAIARQGAASHEFLRGLGAAEPLAGVVSPGAGGPDTTAAALARHERRGVFLSAAIPAMAGLIGSWTVLLAKCVAEVVRTTAEGHSGQFRSPVPYVLVAAVAVSGFAQVHVLNVGLRGYKQQVVVPSFLAVYTTFSILGGIFFFREGSGYTASQAALFGGGTAVSFAGVYAIATRPDQLSESVEGGLLVAGAPPSALSRSVSAERPLLEGHGGGGGGGEGYGATA